MKKKNIVLGIILCFVTLGLYKIFWDVDIAYETHSYFKNKKPTPGMMILYAILTVGLYEIYWVYKIGKELSQYSKKIVNKSKLYFALKFISIFTSLACVGSVVFKIHGDLQFTIAIGFILDLIIIGLIQKDLNSLIDIKK